MNATSKVPSYLAGRNALIATGGYRHARGSSRWWWVHIMALVVSWPQGVYAQKISKDQIRPGASMVLNLPELGISTSSNGLEPVQMRFILPDNYKPAQSHPVLVHLEGGPGGTLQVDLWLDVIERKNFILLAVDYTNPGWASGYRNAIVAVKKLQKITKIDTRSVVLAGLSSGAYSLTALMNPGFRSRCAKTYPEYRKPLHQAFCAFVAIIGGQACPPNELGRRPMLIVGGDQDLEMMPSGRIRFELQKEVFATLKQAGCDVQLIVQPGVGHEWSSQTYPDVRQWLYQKTPAFGKIRKLVRRLEKASSPNAKTRIYKQIASSWFDIEAVRQARKTLALEGP